MRTSGRLRSVYRTVLYGTVPAGAEKEKTDKRGNVSEFPLTPPHAYTVEVEVHSLVISQHRANLILKKKLVSLSLGVRWSLE